MSTRNKLSISKKSKFRESPKSTSISNLNENSPSPLRKLSSQYTESDLNISTPIAHRARSYFLEESPSQDYDIISQSSSYLLTQESHCKDVTWQWNSPKSVHHHQEIRKKNKLNKFILKPRKELISRNKTFPKNDIKLKESGYIRFQKQLKILEEYTNENKEIDINLFNENEDEMELLSHNSSEKENEIIFETKRNEKNKNDDKESEVNNIESSKSLSPSPSCNKQESEFSFIEKNNLVELLDDSEIDKILATQNIEEIQKKEKIIETNNKKINEVNINIPTDDSIDEVLSDFPLEDFISQHVAKWEIPEKSTNCDSKKSFIRYNSMPQSSPLLIDKGVILPKSNFIRNKSSGSLTEYSSSSSTSSAVSSIKCTPEEIEFKRNEAKKRLFLRRKELLK